MNIDRVNLRRLHARETDTFCRRTPASLALSQQAAQHWPGGVPMHWMRDWPTPHPLFVSTATGATLTDVDGNSYADFCLGDTGAMFGHAPEPLVRVLADAAAHGLTYMLPHENAVQVGAALSAMFGLPFWQTTITATDANRSVIRWARAITGRKKLLVFNGCYHGAVDDVFVHLKNGTLAHRPALIGQVYDLTEHTKMVEFNDFAAVTAALQDGDVAAVLTEPALTNIGMVEPADGFLQHLRDVTRETGSLLILDETHTISYGRGGYTAGLSLQPDFITMGKPVAGGLPAAVYGFTSDMAAAMQRVQAERPPGYSGIGTTLSGNALTLAAMRVTLETLMSAENYAYMTSLAATLRQKLHAAQPQPMPWQVLQVGSRVEFVFANPAPRNGTEAQAAMDAELESFMHLYLLNRGVIITPFHNMMLVCPSTTDGQVKQLADAFENCLADLLNTRTLTHAA